MLFSLRFIFEFFYELYFFLEGRIVWIFIENVFLWDFFMGVGMFWVFFIMEVFFIISCYVIVEMVVKIGFVLIDFIIKLLDFEIYVK